MSKTAFITGISGQDGAYLAKFLLSKNYKVIGGDRRTSGPSLWRLEKLGIKEEIEILDFDLLEINSVNNVVVNNEIDEIYNLAAQSFVGTSFNLPIYTANVNAIGVLNILEAIKNYKPKIKFYQASTSEMFGMVNEIPQNEKTSFYPRSPYGISKLFSHWTTINYRESYNLFACNGICFNHESPLRGDEFVTKKIINGLKDIINNKQEKIILGNLNAKRDWGYAADYVEAMWLMLQNEKPIDYVIASGKSYSIREFLKIAASYFDFDIVFENQGVNEIGIDRKSGKKIVEVSKSFYRPTEVDQLIGDYTKIKNDLNWSPKTDLKNLIKIMINDEY